MHRYVPLLLTLALSSAAQETPEPGPEKEGLRVRLIVENNPIKIDAHTIKLDILNVSTKPVTLVSEYFAEGTGKETYADWIKGNTTFAAFPEVVPSGYQTAAAFRTSPQVTTTIEPGASFSTQWDVFGGFNASNVNWMLSFPTTGLFDVRAELRLRTTDNRQISLWSNAQPFVVGGSKKAPKACTGVVSAVDKIKDTVSLEGAGESNGAQIGDRFYIRDGMQADYTLEVTSLDYLGVKTKVIRRNIAPAIDNPDPKMPRLGMKAGLMAPEKPTQ